jgi:hypothetical protein
MADATEAAVVDANAEALDREARKEIGRAARAGMPLERFRAIRRTVTLTVDLRVAGDGSWLIERVRAVRPVG